MENVNIKKNVKSFSWVGNSRLLWHRGPTGPQRSVCPENICTVITCNERKGCIVLPLVRRRHPTGTKLTELSPRESVVVNTVARKLNQSLRKAVHYTYKDLNRGNLQSRVFFATVVRRRLDDQNF